MQVRGDSTTVLQSVLMCDTERTNLLQEEATLVAARQQAQHAESLAAAAEAAAETGAPVLENGHANGDAVSSSESTLTSEGHERHRPDAATRLTEVCCSLSLSASTPAEHAGTFGFLRA